MRCLGGEHVVQQEVGHIEQAKDGLPAHVHGHQLVAHHISKVLDDTQAVQLPCSHHTTWVMKRRLGWWIWASV